MQQQNFLANEYDLIIKKFLQEYNKPVKTPYLIGVYGGSGSGKTFVSGVISDTIKYIFNNEECKNVVTISQDSYYKGGDADSNYDIPDAIDFDLLVNNIQKLLDGKPIDCPIYDFVSHKRKYETVRISPSKIIIIEGILICTNEKLRNLLNMKIFVDASESTQVFRRIKRDTADRGRTIDEVQHRYQRDVAPSYNQYVKPSAIYANMTINNNGENYVGIEAVLNHVITILNKVCN